MINYHSLMKTRVSAIKSLFCLLALFFVSIGVSADRDSIDVIKQRADSAFSKRNYEMSVRLYSQLAKKGESLPVYYNLGCSYYRLDDIPQSLLWLERASRLDPSDRDIRFNLDIARSKTIDRITPEHQIFFVSLWQTMYRQLSVTEWAILSIVLFVFMLILVAVYLLCTNIVLRKLGFFGAMLCLILCILCNLLAYSQRIYYTTHSAGIIMEPAVTVKSTPEDSGTDLFVIHEGTRVEIEDDTMHDWAEVSIADGKVGWVRKKVYEKI